MPTKTRVRDRVLAIINELVEEALLSFETEAKPSGQWRTGGARDVTPEAPPVSDEPRIALLQLEVAAQAGRIECLEERVSALENVAERFCESEGSLFFRI